MEIAHAFFIMKPTLIGAGVMLVSTVLTMSAALHYWNELFDSAPAYVALPFYFCCVVLWTPTQWLNGLFATHSRWWDTPAFIVESVVINTLIGALLGWAAGKIWRAWKSRARFTAP
jgi:uncharacterized membrane protein YccC